MKPSDHNRRKFLSSLSAAAAGGLLINGLTPLASAAQPDPFLPANEFLFEPGLVYLNTGSLGPCPLVVRSVPSFFKPIKTI